MADAVSWASLAVFFLGMLLLGIGRGATTCALICAPGMLPYIIARKLSVWQSVRLGIIFNAPRILILTVLGALVGHVIAAVDKNIDLMHFARPLGMIGYALIGILLLAGGIWILKKGGAFKMNSSGTQTTTEGKESSGTACVVAEKSIFHRLLARLENRLSQTMKNSSALFILLGGLMSIACLGELALVEMTLLTGIAVGTLGGFAPALLGALTMLFFAIGASLPVILVGAIGGGIAPRIKKQKTIQSLMDITGILLVIVGIVFIAVELNAIWNMLS